MTAIEPTADTEAADQASPAPSARPSGCAARTEDDLTVCARCGLEWPAGMPGPKCNPITFERLRSRALFEAGRAEASLNALRAARRDGMAADVEGARTRLVELEVVLRLVERVTTDTRLRDMLNGKR